MITGKALVLLFLSLVFLLGLRVFARILGEALKSLYLDKSQSAVASFFRTTIFFVLLAMTIYVLANISSELHAVWKYVPLHE